MENDSLNMAGAPADVALQDSAAVDSGAAAPEMAMPTPEQLGISITAGIEGGMPAITVGDTFEFPVTVS